MPCRDLHITSLEGAAPFFDLLASRMEAGDNAARAEQENKVADILKNVQKSGLSAVLEYTRKFDAPDFTEKDFCVSEKAIAKAAASISAGDMALINEAAENIREFHSMQKEKSWFMTKPDGTVLGQMLTPIDRAGLYVPGGRSGETPLISSLLMNAIPAQVAGVPELAIASPPRKDGSISPFILAAAHLLGIKEVYASGGAWAIAALAHGAGPLRPVDLICGPGNIWVSTAKRQLIGQVGIDMLAGPSEILILADKSAKAAWVAADLLSQAEHDPLAAAICITTSPELAKNIKAELERQCAALPRKDIASAALSAWGAIVTVPDMDLAIKLSNRMAPEHLELLVDEPWELLPKLRHAGAIFMGHNAAEPLGDYFAGPNHVLPTLGTARFSSALGVQIFCKKTSIISASKSFSQAGAAAIGRLARLEGLEAHARSAEMRLEKC